MTLSIRGTNLFTVAKDNGLMYDPEVGADGLTRMTTPPVKSVVFGVNLNF
jgi:TonB-dependent starch-binding outer membrane protein SusC